MYSTVLSAAVQGLTAEPVHVEADISNGMPVFHMVGYLSAEVREAGERVRTAIRNIGIQLPSKRMVINLSPANVRKTGTAFDLPIAIAVLAASGVIHGKCLEHTLIIGELGLDGSVRKVSGILPIVLEAKKYGCHTCLVPKENAREGAIVNGIQIIGIEDIRMALRFFAGEKITPEQPVDLEHYLEQKDCYEVDFSDIRGQEAIKRAVEVAVAGGHSLLMLGSPGAGKTMIAKRIPTILPPLRLEESIAISKVYSIMGLLETRQPVVRIRPFRCVHHTVTKAALIGGGTVPKPGELSLAHGGVLFLDELPEFQKQVLEVLRQPLEEHQIRISRNRGTYTFPADTMLVAAMNPCPCGNYPDLNRCTCTETEISNYLGKISQPFLDRLDLCVEVPRIEYASLTGKRDGVSSKEMRNRIGKARVCQSTRYQSLGISLNEQLSVQALDTYCALTSEGEELMHQAFDKLQLTARTYHKILRVARTIADLDEQEQIGQRHLGEAIGFRSIDKKYWGR